MTKREIDIPDPSYECPKKRKLQKQVDKREAVEKKFYMIFRINEKT